LFDLSRGDGAIGHREIGSCEGVDMTGANCSDLPDFLRHREGVAMRDYTISSPAFSQGVLVVDDVAADAGRAFVVPAGEGGGLNLSLQAHLADSLGSRVLDSKELMIREEAYGWLACGDALYAMCQLPLP